VTVELAWVAAGLVLVETSIALVLRSRGGETIGYSKRPVGWRGFLVVLGFVMVTKGIMDISPWLAPLAVSMCLVAVAVPIWVHNRRVGRA
jgi:hypothetical protein